VPFVGTKQRFITPTLHYSITLPFGQQGDDEFEDDSKFPGQQRPYPICHLSFHFSFISGGLTHVDC
jgi:hypothetical protein